MSLRKKPLQHVRKFKTGKRILVNKGVSNKRVFRNKPLKNVVCPDMTGYADLENTRVSDVDSKELAKGLKVELEHTRDPEVAEQISLDHLTEIPDYYTRLDKMEREAFKKKKR